MSPRATTRAHHHVILVGDRKGLHAHPRTLPPPGCHVVMDLHWCRRLHPHLIDLVLSYAAGAASLHLVGGQPGLRAALVRVLASMQANGTHWRLTWESLPDPSDTTAGRAS